jgi:hypothetical protein
MLEHEISPLLKNLSLVLRRYRDSCQRVANAKMPPHVEE